MAGPDRVPGMGSVALRMGSDMRVDETEEQELQELLELLCKRDLSSEPFPLVHLGAAYSKARVDGLPVYRTVVTATGVSESGELEPLGVGVGDGEDSEFWLRLLRSLTVRGLRGVRVVAAADHGGLREAIRTVLPEARFHEAELLESLAEDAPALLDLRIEDHPAD